jgi:hypothetical protein
LTSTLNLEVATLAVEDGGGSRRRARFRWGWALGAVAVCYGLVQLAVTRRVPLGWDEIVYVSQTTHGVPAAVFSAPRARGVVLLVAPVALLTSSPAAIRVYLSLLSATALALAYWPWLRIRRGAVVPLAAALFAAQWLSIFYGNEAMPNLYVAFGAVAATGWLCRSAAAPGAWPPRVALAGAVAFTALIRPFDAVWATLPLLAVAAWKRRPAAACAIAIGLAAGWAEWIVEAYRSYGGPLARLRAAGAENQTGLHLSLGAHLRALDGPLLCRPPAHCGGYPHLDLLWFAAIPPLTAVGLMRRRRSPQFAAAALAAAVAATVAASYILLVGYAAPRFLMPAYALAALPVAEALTGPYRVRVPVALLVITGVVAYAGLQARTLTRLVPYEIRARSADRTVAAQLERLGVTPPCLLYGHDAVQIAYYARCTSRGVLSGRGGSLPPAVRAALATGRHVAVTARTRKPPAPFLTTWRRRPLGAWYAFLPRPRR